MRDENGEWERHHNKELHCLYRSPTIVRVIKSRRLRWAGYVVRMEEYRRAFEFLTGFLRKRDLYEGLGVDGRTILECTLKKYVSMRGIGFIRLRTVVIGEPL